MGTQLFEDSAALSQIFDPQMSNTSSPHLRRIESEDPHRLQSEPLAPSIQRPIPSSCSRESKLQTSNTSSLLPRMNQIRRSSSLKVQSLRHLWPKDPKTPRAEPSLISSQDPQHLELQTFSDSNPKTLITSNPKPLTPSAQKPKTPPVRRA